MLQHYWNLNIKLFSAIIQETRWGGGLTSLQRYNRCILQPQPRRQAVTYWSLTKPSIKRWTFVNKRKNSGSKWAWDNNITRCPRRLESVGVSWGQVAELRASGRRRALGPQWPTVEQMSQDEKEVLPMVARRTLGQNNSLSPSPTHLSHTRNITFSRIKCERYIFIKQCVRSFIEVRQYVWLCYAYICICIMSKQHSQILFIQTYMWFVSKYFVGW